MSYFISISFLRGGIVVFFVMGLLVFSMVFFEWNLFYEYLFFKFVEFEGRRIILVVWCFISGVAVNVKELLVFIL